MGSQTDAQTLYSLLSNNQADTTLFDGFYNFTMARAEIVKFHTTAIPITFTEQTSTVNLPTDLINLLTLIYDDTVLSELSLRELESLRTGWRQSIGSPVAFTRQAENVKTAEVFPIPFETSPPIIPVHGLPTGIDYVPGNGIAIFAQQRAGDCLPYLTLPVALYCLQREYERESDHTDMAFALMCAQIAKQLIDMLSPEPPFPRP